MQGPGVASTRLGGWRGPEPAPTGPVPSLTVAWASPPFASWLWVLSRHATVSTVPRFQGQGRPPGQATGGQDHDRGQRQLRRQPHRGPRGPLHRGRDRPDYVAGGRERPQGWGGVVLHRGRVAGSGQECGRVAGQGEPRGGRGSAPAAELDR